MTDDFVRRAKAYAAEHGIPIAEFERGLDSPASAEVPRPLARAWNLFSLDLDQIVQFAHPAS
jgi:hypothetical protein